MNAIVSNMENLIAFWEMAVPNDGIYIREESYGLAVAEGFDWPNKAWIVGSHPESIIGLETLRPHLKSGMTLAVFEDPSDTVKERLKQLGMVLKSKQVGMSYSLLPGSNYMLESKITRVRTPTEASTWSDVFVSAFGYRISDSVLLRTMDRVSYFFWEWEGKPSATLALLATHGVMGVHCVGVAPSARGKGLATRVMQYAIQTAREQNCAMITLQASEMGLGLYEKIGFSRDYVVYNYVYAFNKVV